MINMKRSRLLLSSAMVVALGACGTPGVVYQPTAPAVTSENDDSTSKASIAGIVDGAKKQGIVVNLPISRIAVAKVADAPKPADGGTVATDAHVFTTTVAATDNSVYKISVLPEESELSFRAIPINDFFSSNKLGVTKYASTDIPITVEEEFTDLTAKRVEQIATVVGKILPIMGVLGGLSLDGPAPKGCKTETLPDFAVSGKIGAQDDLQGASSCWSYSIQRAGTASVDAFPRKSFRKLFVDDSSSSVWPVTACADVTLTVNRKGDQKPYLSVPLRIVDDSLLRVVGLPDKGKIAMHPICGADVTNTPVDRWSTVFDVMTQVNTQIEKNLPKAK